MATPRWRTPGYGGGQRIPPGPTPGPMAPTHGTLQFQLHTLQHWTRGTRARATLTRGESVGGAMGPIVIMIIIELNVEFGVGLKMQMSMHMYT